LEQRYAPIADYQQLKGVKWIVVLSAGASVDPELPQSTSLTGICLTRLLEGVNLHKRLTGTKLVLTGTSQSEGIISDAEVMAEVAREWGVDPGDIIVEAEARDTKDHAVFVKGIVEKDRFVLVTSASHMPRAMALFRGQGMEPTAAPTDYMVCAKEGGVRPGDIFSAGALEKAGRAIHEYLGMVWAKVRGQIRFAKDESLRDG